MYKWTIYYMIHLARRVLDFQTRKKFKRTGNQKILRGVRESQVVF